jgi:hypothetical protein
MKLAPGLQGRTRRHLGVFAVHPRLRFPGVCLAVAWLGHAGLLLAQGPTARVEVRLQAPADPAGEEATPLVVELRSTIDPSLSWSAPLHPGQPVLFRFLPPGHYRLTAEQASGELDAVAGDTLTVAITRGGANGGRSAVADVRILGLGRAGYGTRIDSAALRLLPGSGGAAGIIERADPLVVTERIEGGGAYPEIQRLGASGASWTQTSYRLGNADITDPDPTGYPLLYPNLDALDSIAVITAGQPVDGYGGGTSVTLVPRRPAASWERSVQAVGSPHGFQSVNPMQGAPSIGRLQSLAGGSFVMSGPVSPRLGLLVAGALERSSRVERNQTGLLPSRTQNLSAHLVFSATAHDEWRLFGQNDALAFPGAGRAMLVDPGLQQRDRFTLLSGTWEHRPPLGLAWSANITYGRGSSEPPLAGGPITETMERLRDGPPQNLAAASRRRRNRTDVSWRGDPGSIRWLGARHLPQFGVNASMTRVMRAAPGDTLIGELVDGVPARAWQYTTSGAGSRWSGTEAALWGSDRIPVSSRFDLDLNVRAAITRASRDGTGVPVPWHSVSPGIRGTWRPLGTERLKLLAGYARYSSRLPLNYLSFGDPNSLSGTMRDWEDRNGDRVLQAGEMGTPIAGVGPCCTGGRMNTIAPDLRPPHTNEFLLGVHTRLGRHVALRVSSTDRRQYELIQPVDAANIPENYRLTHVPDSGLDSGRVEDDQLLPVFDRVPSSFGTDYYILQNVRQDSAIDHGVDLVVERLFDGRWGMLFGATAHKSGGIGGNRGFGPDENDQGVLGEVFTDPNAQTHARGRLFFERGYVIKWSGLFRLPHGFQGSASARYQDGQHFARVVLAPGLPQGMEAIAALPRGLTRFTYAFTLDSRLEKQVTINRRRATVLLEVYNLLNTKNEVEENVISGSAFRFPTAVQPPRSLRMGLRFSF